MDRQQIVDGILSDVEDIISKAILQAKTQIRQAVSSRIGSREMAEINTPEKDVPKKRGRKKL